MASTETAHGKVRTDAPASDDRGLVVRILGTGIDNTLTTEPPAVSASTVTAVPAAIDNTPILAANPARKTFEVMNNANKVLYLLVGGNGIASPSNFTAVLAPKNVDGVGGYYTPPSNIKFTGTVQGIWPAGVAGEALVTEY